MSGALFIWMTALTWAVVFLGYAFIQNYLKDQKAKQIKAEKENLLELLTPTVTEPTLNEGFGTSRWEVRGYSRYGYGATKEKAMADWLDGVHYTFYGRL